jgi:putative NADPH-quinone reductase
MLWAADAQQEPTQRDRVPAMARQIVILQGHPSPERTHLGHALADAYAAGAGDAGHVVRRIEVGALDFPLLRRPEDWRSAPMPEGLRDAQAAIGWADHLAIFFPLWTGTMPALFKGFLEQIVRPGFAFRKQPGGRGLAPALTGKSARVVVTMGMPALLFRWSHHAHGVRGLQQGILGLCGIKPVRMTYIGLVDAPNFRAEKWLAQMRDLGGHGR